MLGLNLARHGLTAVKGNTFIQTICLIPFTPAIEQRA